MFAIMSISGRATKLILIVCLAVFQAQVLAAPLLGCGHDTGVVDASMPVACPFHEGETDRPPADKASGTSGMPGGSLDGLEPLLDCTKCALHCTLGAYAGFAADLVPQALPSAARPSALPGRHFYRFSPEADIRPPIHALLSSRA
jgi:hypothetical protein